MEFNQIIEEWRTIPNFPDYIISNLGKIKRTTTQGRWKAGHLIKFGTNGKYPMVLLFSQDHRKPRYIHRLLLEAFIGPCPDGKECNHKDGNRENYSLSNLEWITKSENGLHAYRTGLKKSRIGCPGKKGEKHPLHKLKDGEVYLIKKLLASHKFFHSFIAKMFRVNRVTITYIAIGKNWGHIKYDPT